MQHVFPFIDQSIEQDFFHPELKSWINQYLSFNDISTLFTYIEEFPPSPERTRLANIIIQTQLYEHDDDPTAFFALFDKHPCFIQEQFHLFWGTILRHLDSGIDFQLPDCFLHEAIRSYRAAPSFGQYIPKIMLTHPNPWPIMIISQLPLSFITLGTYVEWHHHHEQTPESRYYGLYHCHIEPLNQHDRTFMLLRDQFSLADAVHYCEHTGNNDAYHEIELNLS